MTDYGSSHRAVRPSELELLRKPPFRERGGFVRGDVQLPSGRFCRFLATFREAGSYLRENGLWHKRDSLS